MGLVTMGSEAVLERAEGASEESVSPDIMDKVLDYLHYLIEERALACTCGNHQLDLRIHVRSVTLTCPACGSRTELPAANEADLDVLYSAVPLLESSGRPSDRPGKQADKAKRH